MPNEQHWPLQQYQDEIQGALDAVLERHAQAPPKLIEAVRYSLNAGGKRLRPALVMTAFDACQNANPVDRPASRCSALAAAAAVELIHTFSLVHDDLPAMDDDDLRRGKPTSHKAFGEATAILCGDAMVALAFDTLAERADPALLPCLLRELARATGPLGMIGGQMLDIENEKSTLQLDALRRLHGMKTGALLGASCKLGAYAARATDDLIRAMMRFGHHLGLAFQITDDLLDVTASAEQLGKSTNKDAALGKNTFPALLGNDEAQDQANQQRDLALEALAPLGRAGDPLATLARFVVTRSR